MEVIDLPGRLRHLLGPALRERRLREFESSLPGRLVEEVHLAGLPRLDAEPPGGEGRSAGELLLQPVPLADGLPVHLLRLGKCSLLVQRGAILAQAFRDAKLALLRGHRHVAGEHDDPRLDAVRCVEPERQPDPELSPHRLLCRLAPQREGNLHAACFHQGAVGGSPGGDLVVEGARRCHGDVDPVLIRLVARILGPIPAVRELHRCHHVQRLVEVHQIWTELLDGLLQAQRADGHGVCAATQLLRQLCDVLADPRGHSGEQAARVAHVAWYGEQLLRVAPLPRVWGAEVLEDLRHLALPADQQDAAGDCVPGGRRRGLRRHRLRRHWLRRHRLRGRRQVRRGLDVRISGEGIPAVVAYYFQVGGLELDGVAVAVCHELARRRVFDPEFIERAEGLVDHPLPRAPVQHANTSLQDLAVGFVGIFGNWFLDRGLRLASEPSPLGLQYLLIPGAPLPQLRLQHVAVRPFEDVPRPSLKPLGHRLSQIHRLSRQWKNTWGNLLRKAHVRLHAPA
mmetsp:Transcript_79040/g.223702  ORF Transcript_79040/g.223702 Transcript_79040/m.223702 type:complete len:511 (-) Transcript_79040:45-1577(-)